MPLEEKKRKLPQYNTALGAALKKLSGPAPPQQAGLSIDPTLVPTAIQQGHRPAGRDLAVARMLNSIDAVRANRVPDTTSTRILKQQDKIFADRAAMAKNEKASINYVKDATGGHQAPAAQPQPAQGRVSDGIKSWEIPQETALAQLMRAKPEQLSSLADKLYNQANQVTWTDYDETGKLVERTAPMPEHLKSDGMWYWSPTTGRYAPSKLEAMTGVPSDEYPSMLESMMGKQESGRQARQNLAARQPYGRGGKEQQTQKPKWKEFELQNAPVGAEKDAVDLNKWQGPPTAFQQTIDEVWGNFDLMEAGQVNQIRPSRAMEAFNKAYNYLLEQQPGAKEQQRLLFATSAMDFVKEYLYANQKEFY